MSDIQKQLALALQQLQKASDAQYDDLQQQLNALSDQLIEITRDLSSSRGSSSSVSNGGSMKKSQGGRSVCEFCANGMFYQRKGADAPAFQCLIADISSPVEACNQVTPSE